MVEYTLNPSTWKGEASGSLLNSKPALVVETLKDGRKQFMELCVLSVLSSIFQQT